MVQQIARGAVGEGVELHAREHKIVARGRTQRKEGALAQEVVQEVVQEARDMMQEMTQFVAQQVARGAVGEGVELHAREHKMAAGRTCRRPIILRTD